MPVKSVFPIAVAVLLSGLGGCATSNTKLQISIVNDRPNSTATVQFNLCGAFAGQVDTRSVAIGADGRGQTPKVDTQANNCSVFVVVNCANAPISVGFAINPRFASSQTADCQFGQPLPTSTGCASFSDSLDRIHLFRNPMDYSPLESSCWDPGTETHRESLARTFLGQTPTLEAEQAGLYNWLLETTPPDSLVLQNLQAGQSAESQIVLLVAGNQFFAQAGNNNGQFVTNAYRRLLDRDPTTYEHSAAVENLDGYWIWVEDDPCPYRSCGHHEFYQQTRTQFTWGVVNSHEFRQVAAKTMYGIEIRRHGDSSEIETQAYHIGSYGLKEGAVRVLKTPEFYNKTTQPW